MFHPNFELDTSKTQVRYVTTQLTCPIRIKKCNSTKILKKNFLLINKLKGFHNSGQNTKQYQFHT